jgi:predicted RNA-binding protein with PUA-like domain
VNLKAVGVLPPLNLAFKVRLQANTQVHLYFSPMAYWLMKSEPSEFSIDDLVKAKNQTVAWFGVRNHLARNYMRDLMKVGDEVLFYHSSCPEPGIAGLAKVSSMPYPDETQWDKKSKYFDAKSTQENPRWMLVDVQLAKKTRLLSLADLRETRGLESMIILQRGNRLSITPITPAEWKIVAKLLDGNSKSA